MWCHGTGRCCCLIYSFLGCWGPFEGAGIAGYDGGVPLLVAMVGCHGGVLWPGAIFIHCFYVEGEHGLCYLASMLVQFSFFLLLYLTCFPLFC